MRRSLALALLMVTTGSANGSGQRRCGDTHVTWSASPAILSGSPVGEGMGIQVQPWYLRPGDLDRIAATGFSVVRWGIPWDKVEKVAGVYDWREVDRFVAALAVSRLRSLVILGYGNRLYDSPDQRSAAVDPGQLVEARPPANANARNAFARFAFAAATRYRNRPITWEIWNEPDNPGFWLPKPDPAAYAALAKRACLAMRSLAPHATILGGVGAAMPNAVSQQENVYEAVVRNGAIDCLDGLTGHAYRMSAGYHQPDPESIEDDNAASRAYLYSTLHIPPRKRFAISEWGYTTYNISADLQAAYLIRSNMMNAATGIPLTVWYEWRDSRADASSPESDFGLLKMQGHEKSSRGALAVLGRIAHAHIVRRLATDCVDARVFLLDEGGKRFLVAWLRSDDEKYVSRLFLNGTYRGEISFMPSIINLPDKISG